MAGKNGSHYPVVRTMGLRPTGSTTQAVIDVGMELSKINRRLMRQGRYYEAKIDLDVGSTAGTTYTVLALRDDWAVQKGFQNAYNAYVKATSEERELLGEQNIARWEDFRVYHGINNPMTLHADLWDETVAPNKLTLGEFQGSQVTDQADVQRGFSWGQPTASQFSILREYDKMGNAQSAPSSAVTTGAYSLLEDDIDDATVSNLNGFGNSPPYDAVGVNQATPWVKIAELGVMPGGVSKLSTGFFTAPCGLILIYNSTNVATTDLNLTVKAGNYKGVHAPTMLE